MFCPIYLMLPTSHACATLQFFCPFRLPVSCPHPTNPYLRQPRIVLDPARPPRARCPPRVPARCPCMPCVPASRSSAFRTALSLSRTGIPAPMSQKALVKNLGTPVMGWSWGGTSLSLSAPPTTPWVAAQRFSCNP